MPVGIIINALSVAIGGVGGGLFWHKPPPKKNLELPKIFGGWPLGRLFYTTDAAAAAA